MPLIWSIVEKHAISADSREWIYTNKGQFTQIEDSYPIIISNAILPSNGWLLGYFLLGLQDASEWYPISNDEASVFILYQAYTAKVLVLKWGTRGQIDF